MTEQFKPGDVVVLKSGGPSMTVESIEEDGGVSCCWFDEHGKEDTSVFSPAMLRLDEGLHIA